jgi:autotransporter-associated beta strand protein
MKTRLKSLQKSPVLAAAQLAGSGLFLLTAPLLAADGNWTGTPSPDGLWSDAGNWASATVASGSGSLATFSGTTTSTIRLDSSREIGGLNFSGSAAYILNNNGNAANVLTLNGASSAINVATGNNVTISAVISGTSGLTFTGTTSAQKGNLTLTGNNTYSGVTTITNGNTGYLRIGSNSALGTSTLFLNAQNGGIQYTAAFNNLTSVAFGTGGGRIHTEAFDVTISSAISGALGSGSYFSKYGSGTLTLAGTNTLSTTSTGGINIGGGYIQVDSNARLGDSSLSLLLNGGGIKYGAAFNDLRNITLGNSDGRLDTNGFDVTFQGTLTGSSGQDLRKEGAGTLTLDGTQNYGGTTVVNAGTLLVNGSHTAAAMSVNANAVLGGTGTIVANTTVGANATLSPGNSPGILSIEGNLTLNNGATYVFEGGDLVDVSGALTLANNWTLALGAGLMDGGSVTLFTYGSLTPGWDNIPTFNLDNLGFVPTGALTLTDTGSSIVLNGVQVIPEPGAAVLFVAGLGLLCGRRRANR